MQATKDTLAIGERTVSCETAVLINSRYYSILHDARLSILVTESPMQATPIVLEPRMQFAVIFY